MQSDHSARWQCQTTIVYSADMPLNSTTNKQVSRSAAQLPDYKPPSVTSTCKQPSKEGKRKYLLLQHSQTPGPCNMLPALCSRPFLLTSPDKRPPHPASRYGGGHQAENGQEIQASARVSSLQTTKEKQHLLPWGPEPLWTP